MTCSNTNDCCKSQVAKKVGQFHQIGNDIGALVEEKNAAYGDSFARSGEVMRVLYPAGIQASQLDDALAIVRILDKLFRIATRKNAFGESPWRDIAGYAILAVARDAGVATADRLTNSLNELVEKLEKHDPYGKGP